MEIFLNVDEVAEMCKVKKSKAYHIIKTVNDEMKQDGYLVLSGRVNSSYLFKRLGLEKEVSRE